MDDDDKVKIDIDPVLVAGGFWQGDETSQYAIAMDGDNGRLVWHRSKDWRTFARHYGWGRVARIKTPKEGRNA